MPKLILSAMRGTRAAQPLATAVIPGTLYYVTDESTTEQSRSGAWVTYADSGGASTTATYLTATDETGTLTNSRQLLAGTNVTFDDTTPGERTINVSAAVVDYVVLSNGVQPPTPVDDGAGNFIYVAYTP